MKKISFFILLVCITPVICRQWAYAQEQSVSVVEIRNPFIPQLPQKAQIVEESPKPIQEDTVKTTFNKPKTTEIKPENKNVVEPPLPPLPQPNFTVTGIIWNTDRPQAIINGQVVDIGDVVQEFKIESINPTGIEVSIKGVKMTVKP